MRSSSGHFDWIAYLLPLGMLIAPLAYYHDHNVHLRSLKVPGSSVSVADCQKAARDSSLVIHVTYPHDANQKDGLDPKVCLPN